MRTHIDKLTVTKIIAEIVKNYPAQSASYLRPQTFANIQYKEDILAKSLDKNTLYKTVTANENLFYSRAWAADNYNLQKISYDYPLVFLIETADLASDHARPLYNFSLGVLGLNEITKSQDTRVNEIKRKDLDLILRSIINEMLNYVYAEKDGNGTYEWISQKKLDALKTANTISKYYIRAAFRTAFKNQNKIIVNSFEEIFNQKRLDCVMCDVQIQGDLTLIEFTYA